METANAACLQLVVWSVFLLFCQFLCHLMYRCLSVCVRSSVSFCLSISLSVSLSVSYLSVYLTVCVFPSVSLSFNIASAHPKVFSNILSYISYKSYIIYHISYPFFFQGNAFANRTSWDWLATAARRVISTSLNANLANATLRAQSDNPSPVTTRDSVLANRLSR